MSTSSSTAPDDYTIPAQPAEGAGHDRPALPPLAGWAVMVAVGLAIWLCDVWLGLRDENIAPWGWRLLAIFVPTVLGLMLRPLPGGALVLVSLTLVLVLKALPPPPPGLTETQRAHWAYDQALAGYAHSSVWLVLAAYFLSRALIKTGLARRIALTFVRLLGHNTLGLSYAVVASDVVLAGMIPSNAARVGGVILPITRSLASLYRSYPGATAGLLGSFLMLAVYQADVVACALFLTGQASNPLAADQALALTTGASGGPVLLTYATWFLYASLPALVTLLVAPWLVYRLHTPAITHTPEATEMARRELRAMGSLQRGEWLMLAVFVGVCTLWVVTGKTTLVALAGTGVLFLSGVLTWDDALAERGAWDVFIWYGGLVQLGVLLNEAGVIKVFAKQAGDGLRDLGLSREFLFLTLLLIFFYAHYAFASITAHILAMYPAFIAVMLALGIPAGLAAVSLAYFANLCAGLTHYGTTPGPIIFGTGYVTRGIWWRVGFLMSVVNVALFLAVGLPWWKFWGLW
jgi:divalent anion:Na+ symporter, DASS family